MHNVLEYGLYLGIIFIFYMYWNRTRNPQNPMGMGTDMGIIFINEYGCEYNSTRPEPTSLSFLLTINNLIR